MSNVVVLLVEDEPVIRDLLEAALTDSGFEVLTARDGLQALQCFEDDASRFSALVTDIDLGPGPSGWEVAQRTRERVATMPVVYMSGGSSHEWSSRGVPGSLILLKPFAPAQLVTAVSTLVTEAGMHAQSQPN